MDLTLYIVERASYFSLNIHDPGRPNWIASFVLDGSVVTETNGIRSEARAGDVMLHPPNIPFSEFASGPGTHLWMAFDLKVAPGIDLFHIHTVAPVVSIPDPDGYRQVFQRLQSVCSESSTQFRDVRAYSLAVNLVCIILEAWQAAGFPVRPSELSAAGGRFLELIRYMEAHLSERVQREDLARLAFLHPGYLDRAFRAAHGVSPMQMLRVLRLKHACKLLDSTELGMDAIAEACGLPDATYLSKMFRRGYRMSPSQYREGSKKARESYISH